MSMNLFHSSPPISIKIFVLFASLEVIESIIDSYFGFNQSVKEIPKYVGGYLPDYYHPIFYLLYIGMNTIFDATQMYFIAVLRNNTMRIIYLLSNIFVFYGFFTDTDKVMRAFYQGSSQDFIVGILGLVALMCATVTSICLTNKNLVHWMKHHQDNYVL
jgi:hypothetical protein